MTRSSSFAGRLVVIGMALLAIAENSHAADPVRGAALYQTYCLDCHGTLQAATNATVFNARSLAPVLREGIANTRSGMGFLGDILSTADIDSVVAYLGTDPGRFDFGDQPLGGSTVARSFTVQAGREDLTGLRTAIQGDYSAVRTTCSDRLVAGTTCTVDVRFQPQGAGERSGLLSISHSGVSTPVRITLDGRGRADLPQPAALLTLDLRSLDFGSVTAGQASAEAGLTLRNSGNADLTVLSAVAPVGFNIRNECGGAVRPGGTCRLGVVFQPASFGAVSGELAITGNQAGGVVLVPITGTGAREVARLSWTGGPTRIDFASTPVGRASALQTLALVNQGPGPVSIEALTVTGSDAGEFVLDATSGCQPPLTLAVGAQCSIAISFAPRSTGERSARLAVQASAQLPATLTLAGTATPAATAATPTNLGAGGCTVGSGHPAFDPWWPMLVGLSIAVLVWRRWQRARTRRQGRPLP